MLQHDITNDKYYYNGSEISADEYAIRYKEWEDNLPPASTDEPDIDDIDVLNIVLGGAE